MNNFLFKLHVPNSKRDFSYCKGSFPLIAKANPQAHWENFHPITTFESTRCELTS
jgi:hypothetical protein